MCGILGILNLGEGLEKDLYAKFSSGFGLMHGRGPDGYWIYAEEHLLMGQAVLQITDPTGEIKPYVSNDLNTIACANGEIYNSAELRRQLEQQGVQFTTHSDCEVIAHGYAQWKEGLFERLEGMFAIAVFDRQAQTLFILRDRGGIRPVYYTLKPGHYLAFASEPRILTNSGLADREMSPIGCFHALVLRRPMEPFTMTKQVQAVLPGQLLKIQQANGQVRMQTYAVAPKPLCHSPAGLEQPDDSLKQQELLQTLNAAVEKRVPESCNYSLFLSGGLDSSLVNYLTPANDSRRLPSMVSGFSFSGGIDERELAQKAADIVKTRLLQRSVSMSEFLALWPLLVWLNDEPLMFNSSVPLFLLCREARNMGAKVMLSGEGADEMFVGYTQYPAYQQHQDDGSLEYLCKYDQEIIPFDIAKSWAADPQWFEQQRMQFQDYMHSELPFQGSDCGLERKLEFDRLTFMRGLLMRQDRVGLNASIEIRVPFLDAKVMQLANTYPSAKHLYDGLGKRLLRNTFEPVLGRELTQIPKIGFPLPLPVWLLEPEFKHVCLTLNKYLNQSGLVKQDAILDIMSSSSTYSATSYRHIWTLLNLALWWVNSQTQEAPPHGIWQDIIPADSLRYTEEIMQESRHLLARDMIFNALKPCQQPCVLHAKQWGKPQTSLLEALF